MRGPLAPALLLALAAAACSTGTGGGSPPHLPFPQVPRQGGPVLAHPRVVAVTFPGYLHQADMAAYAAWITTSSWLTTVGSDYGVGAGSTLPPVALTSDAAPATATDASTQALLARRIADGTLPPASSADPVLYLLYYPQSTTVYAFDGAPNCNGPLGGYHWEMRAGGVKVPYAVLPACASGAQALGYLQAATSHELIEAATDPFPRTDLGWAITDLGNPWAMAGGEVGDLCEVVSYALIDGFYAQRSWSNSAAAGGGDPCLPAPGRTFYDTSAAPDTAQNVPAGGSTTFSLAGWSSVPTTAWALSTFTFGDFSPPVSLSAASLNEGGSASMTVTVPAGTAPGKRAAVILLSAHDLQAFDLNDWMVEVVSQ